MSFNFDTAFNDLLKAEESAGRPVSDEFIDIIRGSRIWWRSALLVAKDIATDIGSGTVTFADVAHVVDRFPPVNRAVD